MDRHKNNAVLIVAAGRGSRMRSENLPKQYLKLGQQTVLNICISTFADMPDVDLILPVIHPDDLLLYKSAVNSENLRGLLPPVFGGATRQQSVLNGLIALEKLQPHQVFIHDAARPFTSPEVFNNLSLALKNADGALPGVPLADTLKRANNMSVETTVSRENLWRAQTPQAFQFPKILEAHRKAQQDATGIQFTDDASIAEWAGLSVTLVQGHENNRKLTTPEDLVWAREYMEKNNSMSQSPERIIRTGTGFDVHAFTEGDHVILCGVKIPHDKALKGHSDADVAMHALTDAIFGAMADGDIGQHFPPSDPQWKGAASHIFLEFAVDRVKKMNGVINNVDVTLMCETPKIGPNSLAMREKLAEIMSLPLSRISVKATTTEKLGFTGRREGIACMATATLSLPE